MAEGKSPEEVLASLGRPDAGSILKLARFLLRRVNEPGIAELFQEAKENPASGMAVLYRLLEAIDERDLYELGEILLLGQCEVNPDNFDLVWVTEALAIWAENIGLEKILKNVQRTARALAGG